MLPMFEQAREPIFLLNRKRRFLFVNEAWEEFTGVMQAEAKKFTCLTRTPNEEASIDDLLRNICSPPQEVFEGKSARVRRLFPAAPRGERWWEIDFLPLHDENGLFCILGRIAVFRETTTSQAGELADLHDTLSAKLTPDQRKELWRPEQVLHLRQRVYERCHLDHLPCATPDQQRLRERIRLAGQSRATVFLYGETGVGKKWLARTIHGLSAERERACAILDCEHLPTNYLSSLLFGPNSQLSGVGSLYLREPGSLPRDLQVRLLDRIRESLRAGSDVSFPRILAGCRGSPTEQIAAGQLLGDLYYALATLVIEPAPLRERRADLPAYLAAFLERASEALNKRCNGFTEAALECLHAYRWPGNLSELYAVVMSALRHAAGNQVDLHDLPHPLRLSVGMGRVPGPVQEKPIPLESLLEEVERRLILLALTRTHGNKTKAAELLSIFRPRLLRRMETLGIADPSGIVEDRE